MEDKFSIYLAASLFSIQDRAFNSSLRDELVKLGYEVYLPQEFVNSEATPKEIFDSCVEYIDKSNLVLAVCDGAMLDDGMSWELGYSYNKKPIIGFRSDFRVHTADNYMSSQFGSDVNAMIEESCNHFFRFWANETPLEMANTLHQTIKEYISK